MKKKIYYLTNIELLDVDGIKESTGHKTIDLFSIEKDSLGLIGTIHCLLKDNSFDKVNDFILDEGLGDESTELIPLN